MRYYREGRIREGANEVGSCGRKRRCGSEDMAEGVI